MTENIVVRGFVATYPTLKHLPNGTPVVNFRVASTPRWFDNATQTWKEGSTNWYTVNAFRQLAHNACRSLQIGHPVFVSGKLKIKTWDREDGSTGSSVEIDATTLGHDLALGTAGFQRNVYPQAPSSEIGESNQPQNTGQDGAPQQNNQGQQHVQGEHVAQSQGQQAAGQQPAQGQPGGFYQDQARQNPQTWGETPEETQQNLASGQYDDAADFGDNEFDEAEEKEAAFA